jgi:hypothetical protein
MNTKQRYVYVMQPSGWGSPPLMVAYRNSDFGRLHEVARLTQSTGGARKLQNQIRSVYRALLQGMARYRAKLLMERRTRPATSVA